MRTLDRLAVYSILLAIARIDEVMVYFWPMVQSSGAPWIALNAALWIGVIWFRGAMGWLTLASIAHLIAMLQLAPGWRNHQMWGAILDAVTLTAALRVWRFPVEIAREKLTRVLVPAVISQLILLYLFAAVAKMNLDFINPNLSCVTAFLKDAEDFYGMSIPAWFSNFGIWATILLELGVPIGLMVPRVRPYAVILGLCCHLAWGLLSHFGIVDFSLNAIAMYSLLLPPPPVKRVRAIAVLYAAVLLWGALNSMNFSWLENHNFLMQPNPFSESLHLLQFLVFLPLALYATLIAIVRRYDTQIEFNWKDPVQVAPLVLFMFLGLGPYLGYRTAPALTHFSNLRTDGSNWNHLFLPSSLKIFGYEENSVEIVSTDMPWLGYHMSKFSLLGSDGSNLLPYRGVLALAAKSGGETKFRENGRLKTLASRNGQITVDGELVPLGWLARKFISFRNVSAGGVQSCKW